MNIFESKTILNKTIAGLILFTLCFSLIGTGLFYPKKLKAALPVYDAKVDATLKMGLGIKTKHAGLDKAGWAATIAKWIESFAKWAEDHHLKLLWKAADKAHQWWVRHEATIDKALRVAWTLFRKTLLDHIAWEIVKWIQGEGDPKFITDWKGFLRDAVDVAGGKFLEELGLADLCSPFHPQLNIVLRKYTFQDRVRCTLSEVVENITDFYNDFRRGGWKGWIRIIEPRNHFYGSLVYSIDEKARREAEAKEVAKAGALANQGIKPDKICKQWQCECPQTGQLLAPFTISGACDEEAKADGCKSVCAEWDDKYKISGPIANQIAAKAWSKDIDWLITNEEWTSYVALITDALINRLFKEGIMAITESDTRGISGTASAYSTPGYSTASARYGSEQEMKEELLPEHLKDTTAPTTQASIYDEWHIQITANEDCNIYYTTDGSEPSLTSFIYEKPIEIREQTTLKWFGVDFMGNQEGIHTQTFTPPFRVIDQTPPSVIAVAGGQNEIALLSNEPATIYYTATTSDIVLQPTIYSDRYIKLIKLSGPTTISWFGVDSSGNQQTIQTLTTAPPFPNTEFSSVTDLKAPMAFLATPGSWPAHSWFELDPSSSADFDDTPRIVMYEWDFDNDGLYDWWMVDWNRDGVLDESVCRSAQPGEIINCSTGQGIGNGFEGLRIPTDTAPGLIEVKYDSGRRQITLRVTDDEGVSRKDIQSVSVGD